MGKGKGKEKGWVVVEGPGAFAGCVVSLPEHSRDVDKGHLITSLIIWLRHLVF